MLFYARRAVPGPQEPGMVSPHGLPLLRAAGRCRWEPRWRQLSSGRGGHSGAWARLLELPGCAAAGGSCAWGRRAGLERQERACRSLPVVETGELRVQPPVRRARLWGNPSRTGKLWRPQVFNASQSPDEGSSIGERKTNGVINVRAQRGNQRRL
ncbi:uncharacterized protein LOC135414578 isoform X2 [Pseudopipra pipra]|uniref:uncharacterized protein LOC135414578 isoform X2 n=1 Tax=Pseudopipra pipra TaxID=415032 RepID=UPI003139E521